MRQHPARAGRPRFLCPLPLPHCPARRHQRQPPPTASTGAAQDVLVTRSGAPSWISGAARSSRWIAPGPREAAQAVAVWLQTLDGAWVAIDAPFTKASSDRAALVGADGIEPRAWSRQLVQRYSECQTFIDAATAQKLIGRHRRTTDQNRRSPFAPTLLQLIYQTHAACQLLASLVGSCSRPSWPGSTGAPMQPSLMWLSRMPRVMRWTPFSVAWRQSMHQPSTMP